MRYEGAVYRPPSEANSLILQVTIGCSHNKCTFCSMYKDKKYRVRDLAEIEEDIRVAKILYGDVKKVFLADGDALAVDTEKLICILRTLYKTFPSLKHIGIYASPGSILKKQNAELRELYKNGLTIAYLGVETGDSDLLVEIRKGVSSEDMIKAGKSIVHSGIDLSCTVILGLAGRDRSKMERHASSTAKIINEICPQFLAALTLMLEPGTVLFKKMHEGKFQLPNPYEIIEELKLMLQDLELTRPCIFRSNHASNYLPIRGTFPQDKQNILSLLDEILKNRDNRFLRPDYLRGL